MKRVYRAYRDRLIQLSVYTHEEGGKPARRLYSLQEHKRYRTTARAIKTAENAK